MTASFFRQLEQHQVDWLLVSGQASILYGAATFSEDIDLWVEPSAENLERCTRALRAAGARYYKLTPPFTAEFAARHHGFHFTLPDETEGVDAFLDVMGCPPRVGDFAAARTRARVFDTAWGALRTVGIVDLVELKKTQRPRDYPVISRLAVALVQELGDAASSEELRWAFDNVFTLSEFCRLAELVPNASARWGTRAAEPLLVEALAELANGGRLSAAREDELEEWFDARMAPLRRADRHFWRPIIDELRELRSAGRLMPEAELV